MPGASGFERSRQLRNTLEAYFDLARDGARAVVGRLGSVPNRIRERVAENRVVRLRPAQPPRGAVLLSFFIEAFLLDPSEPLPSSHSRYWESRAIAESFLSEGFSVDAIRFTNHHFIPRRDYDFAIDVRWNLPRLAPVLGPRCVKIMLLDTSQLLFHSAAELGRLNALYQRRGAVLQPRRFERPNLGLDAADCAVLIGNGVTRATYGAVDKPIFLLPVTPIPLHPETRRRDCDAIRRNFVWFNSGGMVHKGLDLVLEAFAGMPELNLTVCGPVEDEQDFVEAYRRELFETPNIRLVGWVDADGAAFREILDTSTATVLASCSEGQSGAVVTCMHAGVIPIVSPACGIDVRDDFGLTLETCSVAEIRQAARRIAAMPADRLERMSRTALEFVQANNTRERFVATFGHVVRDLIARGAAR